MCATALNNNEIYHFFALIGWNVKAIQPEGRGVVVVG
jgi:hypothetical protein